MAQVKPTRNCNAITADTRSAVGRGLPVARLNWSIHDLKRQYLARDDTLYCYIVATVKEVDGRFIQRGSGPNFDGGLVTLCTCKHFMRTFPDCTVGAWVAGFTGCRTGQPRNDLVYLMKVGWAFATHQELWACKDIPRSAKLSKAAHLHPRGDLFQPKTPYADPHSPDSYRSPVVGHSHLRKRAWRKDIRYGSSSQNRAALLVSDPDCTFVWDQPLISSECSLGRGQQRWTLWDFLSQLRNNP